MNRFVKILLMSLGYFALITAATYILSLIRQESYHFNYIIYAIGGVMFALITEFFPSNRWR